MGTFAWLHPTSPSSRWIGGMRGLASGCRNEALATAFSGAFLMTSELAHCTISDLVASKLPSVQPCWSLRESAGCHPTFATPVLSTDVFKPHHSHWCLRGPLRHPSPSSFHRQRPSSLFQTGLSATSSQPQRLEIQPRWSRIRQHRSLRLQADRTQSRAQQRGIT